MKKITILLIALMVISVGFLVGCTDQNGDDNETNGDNGENNESNNVSGDIDKVEVLGYTIQTEYKKKIEGGEPNGPLYVNVYGSGFYPECCESIEADDVVEYRVTVAIRNIAIETLDSVVVIAEFVDIDNNVVAREDGEQRNIPSGMNTQLGISVSSSHVNFWEISDVKFIIDAN